MLEVFAVSVADENHLLHQLALRVRLGHDFPEDEQEFLQHVILKMAIAN